MTRNRRRRDTGTTKNLRVELQEALDEIGMHVDAILDEWLIPADNGTPLLCLTIQVDTALTMSQNPIWPNSKRSV